MKKINLLLIFIIIHLLCGCKHQTNHFEYESYSIKYINLPEEYHIDIKMPFSDFIFVNDSLYIFTPSIRGSGKILIYEYINEKYIFKCEISHSFGHCNSVDFDDKTNLIMVSSGGTSTDIEKKGIYLIKYDAISIDWDKYIFISLDNISCIGKQINSYFDRNNDNENMPITTISNQDGIRFFTKIIVNLTNYEAKIIEYSTSFYNVDSCNQGGIIFDNKLLQGSGHDGLYLNVSHLNSINNICGFKINYARYNNFITEGVFIYDDKIYIGVINDKIYKIISFNYKNFLNNIYRSSL